MEETNSRPYSDEEKERSSTVPLAERLRPQKLEEVIGQEKLLHPQTGILQQYLKQGIIPSLIFWGPPGTGKTTLAKIISRQLNLKFHYLSAVFAGVSDLKKIFKELQEEPTLLNRQQRHILFLDEIHRFNKLQQDSLLGATEDGSIILIGATTENPSFTINNALLSRVQVMVLEPLETDQMKTLIERVEKKLEFKFNFLPKALEKLLEYGDGDGRKLINLLEKLSLLTKQKEEIDTSLLIKTIQSGHHSLRYDRHDDEHYNLISALHKSLRGSDPDAGLYWLVRMLSGGEDPNYIFRRLLRFAYEDIGLADPEAAVYTLTAWQTYERIGSPEGEVALAQTVIYLGLAPKSNGVYRALNETYPVVKKYGSVAPPKHILNAPTRLMKDLDYGKGYQYDHDQSDSFSGQNYFPESIAGKDKERPNFYHPINRGFEREMSKRLKYFQKLRNQKNS